jgi:hypothetical protein
MPPKSRCGDGTRRALERGPITRKTRRKAVLNTGKTWGLGSYSTRDRWEEHGSLAWGAARARPPHSNSTPRSAMSPLHAA